MKNFRLLFCVLILLSGSLNFVSAQFVLSGEIRPRTEYLHGYKSPASKSMDPAFWTEQRSRLKFDFKSEKYKVGLSMQDVRVWGSTSQLNKSDNFSSIHEAWASILFSHKISATIGRQEIAYDDHRIFGSVDWAQQGRSHDVAKLQYKDSSNVIDIGLAYNQDATNLSGTVYTTGNNYKTMQYAWLHRTISDQFSVSLLFLNNGIQIITVDTAGKDKHSTNFSQTGGTYLVYKKNKINANAAFYYQTGKDATDKDINAYNVRGQIQYKVTERFSIGMAYERLSGTDQLDTANEENNSFNPLYGTNHKFNGYMDYFYVGNHLNTVGLDDISFSINYTFKKFSAACDFHLFASAERILDKTTYTNTGVFQKSDNHIGTEVDLTFLYKYSKELYFQAGYSQFISTESVELLKGGDKDELNNWAYLMMVFKPTFLNRP